MASLSLVAVFIVVLALHIWNVEFCPWSARQQCPQRRFGTRAGLLTGSRKSRVARRLPQDRPIVACLSALIGAQFSALAVGIRHRRDAGRLIPRQVDIATGWRAACTWW